MLHHHLGGVPDERGAPSTTPARSARPRRATRATRKPWPGRRRTSRTCCAPAAQLDGRRKPLRGPGPPGADLTGARRTLLQACCAPPPPPALSPTPPRRLAAGLFRLVATTAFSVASPWVLRYAIDDLTLLLTRDKLCSLRRAYPGPRRDRGDLPLPDAHDPHRVRAATSSSSCATTCSPTSPASPRLLPPAPHRRPHEPGHQRPFGGAHGPRPGDHVHGEHPRHGFAATRPDARHQPRALPRRPRTPRVRVVTRAALRPAASTTASSACRNSSRRSPPVVQENLSGARVVRAYVAGAPRADAVRGGEPRVPASATANSSSCSAASTPASSS